MVDENTSLLSSGGSKDNNGATRRRSKLGSFSRFGGELFISQNDVLVMCPANILLLPFISQITLFQRGCAHQVIVLPIFLQY